MAFSRVPNKTILSDSSPKNDNNVCLLTPVRTGNNQHRTPRHVGITIGRTGSPRCFPNHRDTLTERRTTQKRELGGQWCIKDLARSSNIWTEESRLAPTQRSLNDPLGARALGPPVVRSVQSHRPSSRHI